LLTKALPDVTSENSTETPSTLQWVGMEGIALPIKVSQSLERSPLLTANADVFVSLDDHQAKGIHMSRLHLIINQLASLHCDQGTIKKLLDDIVTSQSGIGQASRIRLSFDLLLNKPALLSGESGYQTYPIVIDAQKKPQGYQFQFELTIPYSSTCPCSASLSQQAMAEAIQRTFPESHVDKGELLEWVQSQAGVVATPHSQRSFAQIRLTWTDDPWPEFDSLVFQIEEMIGTPVQTAVKRADEQEFAKLNAQNLMFCEDAARRIKLGLEAMPSVSDYWLKVEHQESFYAHNAVVIDQKSTAL